MICLVNAKEIKMTLDELALLYMIGFIANVFTQLLAAIILFTKFSYQDLFHLALKQKPNNDYEIFKIFIPFYASFRSSIAIYTMLTSGSAEEYVERIAKIKGNK